LGQSGLRCRGGYAPNAAGRRFLDRLTLAPVDMAKLAHGNAVALLRFKVVEKAR
jgi:hypothetical protein